MGSASYGPAEDMPLYGEITTCGLAEKLPFRTLRACRASGIRLSYSVLGNFARLCLTDRPRGAVVTPVGSHQQGHFGQEALLYDNARLDSLCNVLHVVLLHDFHGLFPDLPEGSLGAGDYRHLPADSLAHRRYPPGETWVALRSPAG